MNFEPNAVLYRLNQRYIAFALILSFIFILIYNYFILGIVSIILLFFLFRYEKDFVIFALIVFCLSFTGDTFAFVREYLAFTTVVVLLIFSLQKYGTNILYYPKPPNIISYFLCFLIYTILLSAVFSGLHLESITAIIRTIIFFLICYLLYILIDEERRIYIYLVSLLFSSLVVSISIYLQLFQSGLAIFLIDGYFARYSGVYNNPNTVGLLLMTTSLISIGFLFMNKFSSKKLKFLVFFYLLNNSILLFIVNSRTAVAGTIISIIFMLYYLNKKLLLKFISISIIIFIFLIIIPSSNELFSTFIRMETVNQRDKLWAIGIEMINDYPIFGVGPDLYPTKISNYVASNDYLVMLGINTGGKAHPHNFLLLMTSENGILGFLSVVILIYIFFHFGFRTIKMTRKASYDYYVLATTLVGIGLSIILRSIFEVEGIFGYGFVSRDLIFWIIFLLILYIYMKFNRYDIIKDSKNP